MLATILDSSLFWEEFIPFGASTVIPGISSGNYAKVILSQKQKQTNKTSSPQFPAGEHHVQFASRRCFREARQCDVRGGEGAQSTRELPHRCCTSAHCALWSLLAAVRSIQNKNPPVGCARTEAIFPGSLRLRNSTGRVDPPLRLSKNSPATTRN
uniref:Uncharacterized protein n=1 Tax=Arundo donax TaxID=35708 RepID=A0A0A9F8I3_ARUDO